MIERLLRHQIETRWDSGKAIIILGPRQVGKTTLIRQICAEKGDHFMDLNEHSYHGRSTPDQLSYPEPTVSDRSLSRCDGVFCFGPQRCYGKCHQCHHRKSYANSISTLYSERNMYEPCIYHNNCKRPYSPNTQPFTPERQWNKNNEQKKNNTCSDGCIEHLDLASYGRFTKIRNLYPDHP